MSDKTGGPAFPVVELHQVTGQIYAQHFGASLRDYFAAHAPNPPPTWHGGDNGIDDCIKWRYYYADAMLKERAK